MKKFLLAGAAGVVLLASGAAVAHNHKGMHGGMHGGMKMDTDANGEITRAEATAASAAAFTRMDANKDGVLNESDKSARKANRFADMDTNSDGQISKAEMEAAHAARMEKRGDKMGGRGGKRMENMTDAQKAEWQAKKAERQAGHFTAMDTDKNGSLSEAEFTAGHAMMREGKGERAGKRGHMGHGGKGGMMMQNADTNADGAISQAEFAAAALTRFDGMDADKNGVVTKEERKAARAEWKGKRGDMPMDMPPPPPAD